MTKINYSNEDNIKSLFKQISKIAIPMALQGVLLSLVQLIDNLFIGGLSSATKIAAGINAINNITFIIFTIVIGFMSGIGIYFAQASGKGDEQLKKKLFIAKIFWTFLWSILLITFVMFFLKDIAKIWLPPKENIDISVKAARDYGLIIFPSLFIDYIVIIFSSSFKEQKKTWLAMIVAIIAIIVNASLNYPLMYTYKMGVKGSAIATLIARLVELCIWIVYLSYKKHSFIPNLNDFKEIKWKDIYYVFPKSFWWMINSLMISFAFTLQIMFMSRLSIDSAAALNSAGILSQIAYAFVKGYTVALNILIMHKISKIGIKNIKSLIQKLQILSIFIGLILGIILASFSWSVFYLYPNYNSNTNKQSMIMIISIGGTLFIGMWSSVFISILKGAGYSKIILILDGLYCWVFTLPLTIIMVYFAKNYLQFGFIYLIVISSTVFKPPIFNLFFKRKFNSFKAIIK